MDDGSYKNCMKFNTDRYGVFQKDGPSLKDTVISNWVYLFQIPCTEAGLEEAKAVVPAGF